MKYKILFVCIHNSARSQMAETFLNWLGSERFEAESAGREPGKLNLNVVQVMKETGIDISQNQTKAYLNYCRPGSSMMPLLPFATPQVPKPVRQLYQGNCKVSGYI